LALIEPKQRAKKFALKTAVKTQDERRSMKMKTLVQTIKMSDEIFLGKSWRVPKCCAKVSLSLHSSMKSVSPTSGYTNRTGNINSPEKTGKITQLKRITGNINSSERNRNIKR
jgi:hypothetical protein